jgi:hypothetical protein
LLLPFCTCHGTGHLLLPFCTCHGTGHLILPFCACHGTVAESDGPEFKLLLTAVRAYGNS